MRPLYEINNDILGCVDMETGEIIDEEKLEALEIERDMKIEGVILWRKDLIAEAEAVKAEGKKLYDRARVCENKADIQRHQFHSRQSLRFFCGLKTGGQLFIQMALWQRIFAFLKQR